MQKGGGRHAPPFLWTTETRYLPKPMIARDPMSHTTLNSPFQLNNNEVYQRWRDHKLRLAPNTLDDIVVEVGDPRHLTALEHTKMLEILQRCNMVIYAGNTGDDPDKEIPYAVAQRFGLQQLNHNWLADGDGITSIKVNSDGERPAYIPYTNHAIKWHTDGYYNPVAQQCHSVMLHCVHPAAQGGGNALWDHEMAYIQLRDSDPALIEALMVPDVMTIPPGTDMQGAPRPQAVGPVFSIRADGELHMRYTERGRNIVWRSDAVTHDAVKALMEQLHGASVGMVRGTLQAGMGLLCNNVLHDRSGFTDGDAAPPRLLYRSRFFDRIAHCGWQQTLKL